MCNRGRRTGTCDRGWRHAGHLGISLDRAGLVPAISHGNSGLHRKPAPLFPFHAKGKGNVPPHFLYIEADNLLVLKLSIKSSPKTGGQWITKIEHFLYIIFT
jgi:hypothetical protein